MKQAGAELCQSPAQLGWHSETKTKQNLHLNVTKQVELILVFPN